MGGEEHAATASNTRALRNMQPIELHFRHASNSPRNRDA
jgi:hypothetical protein